MAKNGFSFNNKIVVEAIDPLTDPELTAKDCGKIFEISASVWPFNNSHSIELPIHRLTEKGWNVTLVQNQAVVDETAGTVSIRDSNGVTDGKNFHGGVVLHETSTNVAVASLYCTASIAGDVDTLTLISSSAGSEAETLLHGYGYPGTRITIVRGADAWLCSGTIVVSGSRTTPFGG